MSQRHSQVPQQVRRLVEIPFEPSPLELARRQSVGKPIAKTKEQQVLLLTTVLCQAKFQKEYVRVEVMNVDARSSTGMSHSNVIAVSLAVCQWYSQNLLLDFEWTRVSAPTFS